MTKFTIEKCKTKAAYSAKPVQNIKLNLKKIKEKFETVLETPILLVIKVKGIEVIVHNYGELLFKNCEDKEKMEKIAERVYSGKFVN
tara:strand:- start:233 stop:493 length:261 start_codon:yes stop_codon:yes gene_type:complete